LIDVTDLGSKVFVFSAKGSGYGAGGYSTDYAELIVCAHEGKFREKLTACMFESSWA
jgi:hypothetical protein